MTSVRKSGSIAARRLCGGQDSLCAGRELIVRTDVEGRGPERTTGIFRDVSAGASLCRSGQRDRSRVAGSNYIRPNPKLHGFVKNFENLLSSDDVGGQKSAPGSRTALDVFRASLIRSDISCPTDMPGRQGDYMIRLLAHGLIVYAIIKKNLMGADE